MNDAKSTLAWSAAVLDSAGQQVYQLTTARVEGQPTLLCNQVP